MHRFTALMLMLILPLIAQAEELSFTPEEQKEILRAQNYLNSITTMEADFEQTSSGLKNPLDGGTLSQGRVYLQRPGKMRWQYTSPSAMDIYINDSVATYHDKELDQISYTTLDHLLSSLIVKENINLMGDELEVVKIRKDSAGIDINIQRKNAGGVKENAENEETATITDDMLTLTFLFEPQFRLYRMRYWAESGHVTSIQFRNAVYGKSIDSAIFNFENPRLFNQKKRN